MIEDKLRTMTKVRKRSTHGVPPSIFTLLCRIASLSAQNAYDGEELFTELFPDRAVRSESGSDARKARSEAVSDAIAHVSEFLGFRVLKSAGGHRPYRFTPTGEAWRGSFRKWLEEAAAALGERPENTIPLRHFPVHMERLVWRVMLDLKDAERAHYHSLLRPEPVSDTQAVVARHELFASANEGTAIALGGGKADPDHFPELLSVPVYRTSIVAVMHRSIASSYVATAPRGAPASRGRKETTVRKLFGGAAINDHRLLLPPQATYSRMRIEALMRSHRALSVSDAGVGLATLELKSSKVALAWARAGAGIALVSDDYLFPNPDTFVSPGRDDELTVLYIQEPERTKVISEFPVRIHWRRGGIPRFWQEFLVDFLTTVVRRQRFLDEKFGLTAEDIQEIQNAIVALKDEILRAQSSEATLSVQETLEDPRSQGTAELSLPLIESEETSQA